MYGKFLVEGDKPVRELLASGFKIDAIYSVSKWGFAKELVNNPQFEHFTVSETELERLSTLENPNQVIAVANMINRELPAPNNLTGLYLACDNLNDPGNAGTIIRLADWFGLSGVIFSENSVDIYNPKVVSAAKGSLFRVNCYYASLPGFFAENTGLPVYGTFMDGADIYSEKLSSTGIIVIGNEANGISNELLPYIQHRIAIPSFGKAESLNAGVAAGIVISEFKRRQV
ncbi:MAG TPA: RNA methyltransferase [Chitinophagales bacterium]|nr:RNA methyltransferase [Chitinophagales bacterium]